MEIDFYDLRDRNRKEILFSIDESFFESNYLMMKNNGIEIDIYGTTILSQKKVELLIELFKDSNYISLLDFFKNALKENISLVIEGN